MTVKELIESLLGCDMNANVYVITKSDTVSLTDSMVYHIYDKINGKHNVILNLEEK